MWSSTARRRRRPCSFDYWDESDGVNHDTGQSFPFYPIPDEAITQAHWIEGGEPGNVDRRSVADRHLLIVDRDNRHLYELYNVYYNGTQWVAGSGAFFNLNTNDRRPDGWTSADAAGLAILPGLVRYDEAFGTAEIQHAFRVTVRATNGYVYPASHRAGSTAGALPMGARLRLKASRNLVELHARSPENFPRDAAIWIDRGGQRIRHVHQRHVRHAMEQRRVEPRVCRADGDDFDVITLGYQPTNAPSAPRNLRVQP